MNVFLYLIKFIASMCVIILHTRFPGNLGVFMDALSRFAVPFFFAVSGRFLLPGRINRTEDIRRRLGFSLKRLIKTTAVVWLVYLIYSLFWHLLNGVSFGEWFSSKFNASEAKWFFLFNSGKFIYDGSYTFDHIWYLFALIYVYALIFIFASVLRKWYRELIVILLGLLYFGELLQSIYPIRPFDISISTWYVMRNWLFVGMPFVLLGILFSDYIDGLRNDLSNSRYETKVKSFRSYGIIGIAVGAVLTVMECAIFGKKEVYIGSLLIVIGILFLSEAGVSGGRFLWKIGKEGSSYIFFYHVLLIAVLDSMAAGGIIPLIPMWLKPLLVMLLSIVIIWFIPHEIKNLLKIREKGQ